MTQVESSRHAAPSATGLVALVRQVRVLERAVDFYVHGLGFCAAAPLPALPQADVVLRLGDEHIALCQMRSEAGAVPRAAGPDVRFQHVAIVTTDMHHACERLMALQPEPISVGGPQQLPLASGGATAFKFRDPDGHPLELLQFAELPERWQQRANGALTLGIDHSAISVSNVDKTIAFYARFGFSVEARQINRGDAQVRLDGLLAPGDDTGSDALAGVEVEVVTLALAKPGSFRIELLAYRAPQPVTYGAPVDCEATDHWQDELVWHANAALAAQQDPDGHLLSFVA